MQCTQRQCIQWVLSNLPEEQLDEINMYAKENASIIIPRSVAKYITHYLQENNRIVYRITDNNNNIALLNPIQDGNPYFLMTIHNKYMQCGERYITELFTYRIRNLLSDKRIPIKNGKFSTNWEY